MAPLNCKALEEKLFRNIIHCKFEATPLVSHQTNDMPIFYGQIQKLQNFKILLTIVVYEIPVSDV